MSGHGSIPGSPSPSIFRVQLLYGTGRKEMNAYTLIEPQVLPLTRSVDNEREKCREHTKEWYSGAAPLLKS